MQRPFLRQFIPACGGIRVMLAALGLGFAAAPGSPAQAASVLDGPWSGQAQCTLNIQGPGYTEKEVHTWTLTGGVPTLKGAARIFQATWSVTGQGSYQESEGDQTYQAQWTVRASLPSAPIAMVVRASDGRLVVSSAHAQLRLAGGVTGTQQVTIGGVPQTQGTIRLEAFEWQFPPSVASAGSTQLSGSTSSATNGSVGPMQPGGSQGSAQCSWQFAAGAGNSSTPPPGAGPGSNPPGSNPPGTNPPGSNSGGGSTSGLTLTAVSPNSGKPGDTITLMLTGEGFGTCCMTALFGAGVNAPAVPDQPADTEQDVSVTVLSSTTATVVSILANRDNNSLTFVLNISPTAYAGPHALFVLVSTASETFYVQTPFFVVLPNATPQSPPAKK